MAEETTKEEYQHKQREQARYRNQVEKYKKQCDSLDEQIRRLEKARDKMSDCNSDFKAQVRQLDKYLDSSFTWKGYQKNSIIGTDGGNLLYSAEYSRDHIVNKALDDLEWLLTKKKNERSDARGLLGKAESALRSVGTWLKTHFFN